LEATRRAAAVFCFEYGIIHAVYPSGAGKLPSGCRRAAGK
jgi:hypothetical protein